MDNADTTAALAELVLGGQDRQMPLRTRGENRLAAAALACQARRSVQLFSARLDRAIYDQQAFLDAVTALALRGRPGTVRILVHDPLQVIRHGHRLVELARRLTSAVELRQTHPEFAECRAHVLVADETGVLRRPLDERYEGTVNFAARLEIRAWLRFFDQAWELSAPATELRRFHL